LAQAPLTRPFYGILLAPTLVLATYGDTHTSPEHLWRPLVVSIVAALLVFGLLGLTRRWHFAALVTTLLVLAVLGVYPVLAVLALAAIIVTYQAIRRRTWDVYAQFTRPLNVVFGLWLGIALGTAVAASIPPGVPDADPVSAASGPNVYLVLLDGYPRADTLMEYFDFDSQPFFDELGNRGFTVAGLSRSRYTETAQVVPTMLHQRPLEELLAGEWDGSNAQYRLMRRLINHSPTQDAYEAAGYRTYSIVSGATGLDWRTADVVIESPWPSTFERHLLAQGMLRKLVPFDAMHRASVLDSFDALAESAGASPRFVFAHFMSPHDPYVFQADGSPAEPCGSECTNHAGPPNPMLADRLTGQVDYLNRLVLQAVDRIMAVDPEGIIVLFSDHGLRRDSADRDEWFRTLFAARNAPVSDDVVVMDLITDVLGHAAATP
jgi:hypothetical protein